MQKRTQVNMAALLALAALSMTAQAQQLERVEITGSSIKRIDGETAAPVQVLKRADIERTGAANVEQLMRSITAMTSSQSTVGASASGATTGGISTVSMRGLTAERTLVLLNGKRISAYGQPTSSVAVDVDSIPISALERVEILKDGASAVYGSDAIAGVVNFILRKDYVGTEVSLNHGQATEDGKGKITKFGILSGFGDLSKDGYNVMFNASYGKEDALMGGDRKFASTALRLDQNSFGGSTRSDPANISIPGFGVFNPRVTPGSGDPATYCSPRGTYSADVNPDVCLFDTGPFVTLIPKTERLNAQLSGRMRLGEAEVYADLAMSKKEARTVIQPSPIDALFGIPFTMTPTMQYYPTAFVQGITGGPTPNISVRWRPFIIGNRDITDTGESQRFVTGIQGQAGGWDYDANFLHSASKVSETLNGGYFRIYGNNATNPLTGAGGDASGPGIIALINSGRINPFGENAADVVADARATNFIGEAFQSKTSLTGLQGKVSREFGALDGGPMGVALGAETRRESFKLNSSPALASGDISGYGGNFVPISISRTVVGAFAELSAPVSKSFQVDTAVRFDTYGGTTNPNNPTAATNTLIGLGIPSGVASTVGAEAVGSAGSSSKFTGKVGARWKASNDVLFRGTVSTGFRAPSLLDLYGPLQAGVSAVINDPARCRGANAGNPSDCGTQFNIYTGGRSNLKPESADNLTLGMMLEPSKDLSIGVDYYFLKIKNLIQTLSASYILENESAYAGRVTRGTPDIAGLPGPILAIDQRLENLGKAYVSGVDLDIRGKVDSAVGRFSLGSTITYTSRWQSQNPDGTYDNAIGETSNTSTGLIPRTKIVSTVAWQRGPWTVSATHNWQSAFTDICGNLLQDDNGNCADADLRRVGAYDTVDVQTRYEGIKGLGLTVGIKNLLKQDPPFVNGTGGAFQSGYDPTYVDPRGRFLYVNATYKF